MSADDDAELLAEFLVEGRENLDRLERELLAFEDSGTSAEMVAAVFRTAHTVKGTAGFFGFTKLQHLMHTAETLLAHVRDGELVLTSPIVSLLLDATDSARTILASIEARTGEGDEDLSGLVAKLESHSPAVAEEEASPPAAIAAAPPAAALPPPAPVPAPPPPAPAPAPAPARAASDTASPQHAAPAPATEPSSVRVDTTVLDRIMDLAGELVLTRNQLLQLAASSTDTALVRTAQRLDSITSELQEGVMRTRMQPIGGAWTKLPRVVRDLAGELGKKVELVLEGQDTALDRTVLEAIRDPLTHLVRNAVDHGIESPERRVAAGKAAVGTLTLAASHSSGHVVIEIRDDGGGIDPERVRSRAVERGLMTAERAAHMTEAELVQLIFAPGFSTAQQVTNVSGRGVGMDVVKTNVEKIGGMVIVRSRVGEGTTVRIDIPLTLAIIPALLVDAMSQRYAIPESSLVEILRIDPDTHAGELGVEYIHGAPVYRRHGELIPLVVLSELFARKAHAGVEMPAYVVVLATEGRKVGIVVDDLHDSEEIVVKPLSKHLSGVTLYAGATILGDGRVALILDPRGLATAAGIHAQRATAVLESTAAQSSIVSLSSMLIVRGRDRRLAVPLSEVARLEELPASAIERAGHLEVVQYRDKLLPLVRLGDPASKRLTIVVHSATGAPLGLVVDSIVDVIEVDPELDRTTAAPGIRGSAVIGGHATDVLDVYGLAIASGVLTGAAA